MSKYAVKIRSNGKEDKTYITARSAVSADRKAYRMMVKANGDRYIVYPVA